MDILRADGTVVTCRVEKVDAPETGKPESKDRFKQPDQAYSREATKVFESLLGDKNVDVNMRDAPRMSNGDKGNYGRKLCMLAKDGKSINLELVKQGAAWADHYKGGDAKFIEAEALAHADKLGLHVDKDAKYPRAYRDLYDKKKH